MRIDVHTHFQSLDFIKHLMGRSNLPKSVLDGGTYLIQCAPGLKVPTIPGIIDMDQKLRDMDDLKIDVAVLSHGLPFGPDVLSGRDADEWAIRINDDLARIIADCPGRFVGLGSVGFGDYQRSIAEVDRCARLVSLRYKPERRSPHPQWSFRRNAGSEIDRGPRWRRHPLSLGTDRNVQRPITIGD